MIRRFLSLLAASFFLLPVYFSGSAGCNAKVSAVTEEPPPENAGTSSEGGGDVGAPMDFCAFSGNPFGECAQDADCGEGLFCDEVGCCVPVAALACQPYGPCDADGSCPEPGLICEEPKMIDGVEQGRCCIPSPAPNVCPLSGMPLPDCDPSLVDQCPDGQFCSGAGCCVEGVCEMTCEQARAGFCDGPCPDPCAQADPSLICGDQGCCVPGPEPAGCTTCGDASCELHETLDNCFFDCSGRGFCKLTSSLCFGDEDCPSGGLCLGGCCGTCNEIDGCTSGACRFEACQTEADCRAGGTCDAEGCCGSPPGSACGDGICDPYESCRPSDCPPSTPEAYCGDGVCDPEGETETCCDCVCPLSGAPAPECVMDEDCDPGQTCDLSSGCCIVAVEGPVCGDSICEPGDCPEDCPGAPGP